MSQMDNSSVSTTGQIRIPAHMRKKYGIRPGMRVRFIERENEIAVQPLTEDAIERACGMLKSRTSATRDLLRMKKEEKKLENAKAQKMRP